MADIQTPIQQVTGALMTLLQDRQAGLTVVLQSPAEVTAATNNELRVSLWLYLVSENEFGRNPPATATVSSGGGARRSLTARTEFPDAVVNLYYLATPLTGLALHDQEVLNTVIRVFHTHGLIRITTDESDLSARRIQDLRITPCRLALEELTRIWDSLRQPYRLSVCYEVRGLHIPSQVEFSTPVVTEQSGGFGDRPAEDSTAAERG